MAQSEFNLSPDGVTLILGGVRSGKSEFGEEIVRKSALKPIYLATGRAEDEEMRERILRHQERRDGMAGPVWETVEEPLALVDALRNCAFDGRAVLVDCLTLWVTNLMLAGANVSGECENLITKLEEFAAPIVFVSNEVGLGIMPENKLAREFGDHCGMLHQNLAAKCNQVFLVAAGIPQLIKQAE